MEEEIIITNIDTNKLVDEYLTLQRENYAIDHNFTNNETLQKEIAHIQSCIDEWRKQITTLCTNERTELINNRQTEILETLKDGYDGENKKMVLDEGTISWTVTKTTVIDDPDVVCRTLAANNKISEGVQSFRLTFIKKLIETGLLEGAAHLQENINVKILPPKE